MTPKFLTLLSTLLVFSSTIGVASAAPTASTASAVSSAPKASPTVPYASDEPNAPAWNSTTPESEADKMQPVRGQLGGTILGPNNIPLVMQNPDSVASPTTDNGAVQNFKWPFALSHTRLSTGGWARQQNVDTMPIATEMAGVDMRLEAGAIRELHWHDTAEWAYVLSGDLRITALSPEGQTYVGDVGAGDLWYFPPGYPHSIQAKNSTPEGSEFLLIFDDGAFSDDSTFSLTDWLSHTPKEVLARNFQVPMSAFDNIPSKQLYIFPADAPPDNVDEAMVVPNDSPNPFTYHLSKQPFNKTQGGSFKVADSTNFPMAQNIAVAEVEVEVGGMRELHWHPTQAEWGIYLQGNARMTAFASSAQATTLDFQAGDISYVPPSYGHYIENIGNETLRFLEIFKTDKFQDVSLMQWLALTPRYLVQEHLGLSDEVLDAMSQKKLEVVGPHASSSSSSTSSSSSSSSSSSASSYSQTYSSSA